MAQQPITTIPPFSDNKLLPACAASCGPLYDANGGCVPPVVDKAENSVYTACFCSNDQVKAFSTTSAGVCDNVCDGTGLNSIASWFRDICSVKKDDGDNGGNNGNGGNINKPTTTGKPENVAGGSWIDGHWKWVVMLAVLVVAIAGIWIGACIWRRHYLKKRDRRLNLKPTPAAPWGPGAGPTTSPPVDDAQVPSSYLMDSQNGVEKSSNSRWSRR